MSEQMRRDHARNIKRHQGVAGNGDGMTLFILAYLFYAAGENFMASFLPELAPHRVMGRVSAFGWTMGYVGGLLCLAVAAFGARRLSERAGRWLDGVSGLLLVAMGALLALHPEWLMLLGGH